VIGLDASDAEMNDEVAVLRKPVSYTDREFGTFTLDRRLNWFMTNTKWNGRDIRLKIAACEPSEVERSLDIARKLWLAQESWQAEVLSCAARELLPVKNATWLGEGETKITAAQFTQRMELQWITVWPNGEFTFWHKDGELFFGHDIEVAGTLATGLKTANIHG
jgi:hypothetical protein